MTTPLSEAAADSSLVERIAAGDRDALETLVNELGGPAYSLARRITADPLLAEEAVQDAFVELWRRASTYDPHTASVATWVLGYVRNKAIDRVRHEQRRRPRMADGSSAVSVDVSAVDVVDEDTAHDPVAAAWTSSQSLEVVRALSELGPDGRQLLELAYFSGLSQAEIAASLDIPIGTVKTRTQRALARLRDILTARGLEG